MADRAAWRTLPDDPRTTLGWLAREAIRWAGLALKKALLGVFGLAVYAWFAGQPLAFVALAAAFACLMGVVPKRPQPPQAADPPPGPAFAGTVEIRKDGALLGGDRIVATFVDGWLHVEGHRAAFSLRASDVARFLPKLEEGLLRMINGLFQMVPGLRRQPNPNNLPSDWLRLTDGTELRFDVTYAWRREDFEPGLKRRPMMFTGLLHDWGKQAPEGESTLPPDRPHPSAGPRAVADLIGTSLGFVAGIAIFVVYGWPWGLAAFVLAPGPSLDEAIRAAVRLRRHRV